MIKYYVFVIIVIALLCLFIILFKKWISKSNTETDISTNMMLTGIALITAAFPGTKETVMCFVLKLADIEANYSTDYAAIGCGILLIVFGIVYRINIRDRIFILNMFGIPVQKEISDEENIKDLRLADFKVKESIVDFVDVFKPVMTEDTNQLIVKKIKTSCIAFFNRSKDYKSCFTGMAPIPYTILAGNYLSAGKTRRYFEYRRSDSKYYELTKKSRKHYDNLEQKLPDNIESDSKEVVVALSVTRTVKSGDLVQFDGMDCIDIKLSAPNDNIIVSVKQLDEYTNFVLNSIESLTNYYPKLEKVHLVASIPSCLSLELGKKFALNSHRLVQIISYHYVNSQMPKYPFGIIVSDGNAVNRGKLIKGE